MNNLTKIFFATVFTLGVSAQAQVVLQDFTTTLTANTFFYGTWEPTGSVVGTTSPNAQFSQGSGVYNITGSLAPIPKDDAGSKIEFFNTSPVSIGSNLSLAVTAQTLVGNVATSFTVFLVDTSAKTATAAFSTSAFPNGGYTTQTQILTLQSGFNAASIDSMIITGNQPGGTATFNMSFDNISAVTAVPEPSTYAAVAGVLALGFVAYRRRQQAA